MSESDERDEPIEIAIVGDLTDHESDITEKLLDLAPGGRCIIYFDSPGGSPYCAMSIMMLLLMRRITATGIVTGECSSAALWPLAACQRRIVTPFSVLLFHPMRWQSEENVGLAEAAEWARHFGTLEQEMDQLLATLFQVSPEVMTSWITPGKYVSGRELAEQGLAECVELHQLEQVMQSIFAPAETSDCAPAQTPQGGPRLKAHRPAAHRKAT